MMRAALLVLSPLVASFWIWHFLASHDVVFSRGVHDVVFAFYGALLGIDPASIPSMLAEALFLDAAIVVAIVACRKRRGIIGFVRIQLEAAASRFTHRPSTNGPARPAE